MGDLAKIFKAYDVRGVVPDEFDEETAEAVGAAFVEVTGARTAVVAHDMRASSGPLAAAFIRGAASRGADVVHAGLGSTDLLYYASGSLALPGVMFTASHNPARYNGMKMCRAGAVPIGSDTGLVEIRDRAAEILRSGGVGGARRRNRVQARPAARLRRPPARAGGPVGHPAPAGRGRRGQRDGRSHRARWCSRDCPSS